MIYFTKQDTSQIQLPKLDTSQVPSSIRKHLDSLISNAIQDIRRHFKEEDWALNLGLYAECIHYELLGVDVLRLLISKMLYDKTCDFEVSTRDGKFIVTKRKVEFAYYDIKQNKILIVAKKKPQSSKYQYLGVL